MAQFKEGDFALYQYFQKAVGGNAEVGTNRDDVWVQVKFEVDEEGIARDPKLVKKQKKYIEDLVISAIEDMPEWNPATKGEDTIASTVNLDIRVSYSRSVAGIYTRAGIKPMFFGSEESSLSEEEPAIVEKTRAMKSRTLYLGMNDLDTTERLALVMDVTEVWRRISQRLSCG